MPRFEPFRGLRYDPARVSLSQVIAPPYDVLSEADRAALAARDPHNIVHVDVPLEADGAGRYDAAATTLHRWVDEGVLVREAAPTYYLYRMSFTDEAGQAHDATGVLGALEVLEPGADVLPHEQTTPKAKTDRLDLTRATATNLSPVWGLSLADGLAAALEAPGALVGEVVDEGVTHRIELVDAPARVATIRSLVAGAPVVIADGHHRYEVARTYRAEQRAAHGDQAGPWDLTLALVVELAEDQLFVQAIHRLLDGVPIDVDLEAVLAEAFSLEAAGPVDAGITLRLQREGALCLVRPDGTGVLLRPRPNAFDGVADLDSARLEHALAGVPHDVRYQHGVEHVVHAVTGGEAQYAVLLRPVTVAQIAATAHERALMPPKSTFFAPKPRTGLVLREVGA